MILNDEKFLIRFLDKCKSSLPAIKEIILFKPNDNNTFEKLLADIKKEKKIQYQCNFMVIPVNNKIKRMSKRRQKIALAKINKGNKK